jgi:hypothetical protein
MTTHYIYPYHDGKVDHDNPPPNSWIHSHFWIEIAEYAESDISKSKSKTLEKFKGEVDAPYPPLFKAVKAASVYQRLIKLMGKFKAAKEYTEKFLLEEHKQNETPGLFVLTEVSRDRFKEVMNQFLDIPVSRGSCLGDVVVANLLHDFKDRDNLKLWVVQRHIALRAYSGGELKYKTLPVWYGGDGADHSYNAEWISRNLKMSVTHLDELDPDEHAALYLRGSFVPGFESDLEKYKSLTKNDKLECQFSDLSFEASVTGPKVYPRNANKSFKRRFNELSLADQQMSVSVFIKSESICKKFVGVAADLQNYEVQPTMVAAAIGCQSGSGDMHIDKKVALGKTRTSKLGKSLVVNISPGKIAPPPAVEDESETIVIVAATESPPSLAFLASVAADAEPIDLSITNNANQMFSLPKLTSCKPQSSSSSKNKRVNHHNTTKPVLRYVLYGVSAL